MVTGTSKQDSQHLERMILSRSKRERPSTANTMVLVLKPRREDYKQPYQISGSENEREAYRKNRVMQMKLSSYLAEVCLQQRSSERLLETQVHRFMQEVSRRASIPRSVALLQQLRVYTKKTFPKPASSQLESSSQNEDKPLPVSAQDASGHQVLLKRSKIKPNTSRQNLGDNLESLSTVLDKEQACMSRTARKPYDVEAEEWLELTEHNDKLATLKQTSKAQVRNMSGDNNFLPVIASDSSRRSDSEYKPKLSTSNSFTQMNPDHAFSKLHKRQSTIDKFVSRDLSIGKEDTFDNDSESGDSFTVDMDLQLLSLSEEALKVFDNVKHGDAQNREDQGCDVPDVTKLVETGKNTTEPSHGGHDNIKSPQKQFSHVKSLPIAPLRHNITSVLRQERARYRLCQKQIRDYTLTSRASSRRILNVKDKARLNFQPNPSIRK